MSRVAGIDVRDSHVRIAVLKAAYRKIEIEELLEEPLADHESVADAMSAALAMVREGAPDSVVTTLPGQKTFAHKLVLPPAAEKRLNELLPFELESELPIEIDEVVFDHRTLLRRKGTADPVAVVTLAARREHVEQRIAFIKDAIHRDPERIGGSALELGQLTRFHKEQLGDHPVALVDLGFSSTDVCVVTGGEVQMGRTLSLGIGRFPDGAEACVAQLRQTLSAYDASTDQTVGRVMVVGDGALLSGIAPYLADRLGLEVEILGPPSLETMPPEMRTGYAAYGRAVATAIHGVRGAGFDLRQGDLAFERGYDALKERAPLLAGLLGAVLISFFFATWAEARALEREHEALATSLEAITDATFEEKTSDPDQAEALLMKARKTQPEDPMSYLDGFGVAVALSEQIAADITHDIEELDYSKGSLKLRGLVNSTDEAQRVAKAIGKHDCFQETKITKITQVVNSERERYNLEAEVRCPQDQDTSKKGSKRSGGDE